jgi:hypothetical protein
VNVLKEGKVLGKKKGRIIFEVYSLFMAWLSCILQMLLLCGCYELFSFLPVFGAFSQLETPYLPSETQEAVELRIQLKKKKACIYPVPLGSMCYVENA